MSIPFTTESDNRPFDVRSTARNHTHRFEIMQELFDLRRDDEWIMAMRVKPRYVLIMENILIKQAQLSRTEHIREDSWAVDPEVCAANRGHLRRALAWFRERSMLRQDGILPIISKRLEMTFEEFLAAHGMGDNGQGDRGSRDPVGDGHNGAGHNGNGHGSSSGAMAPSGTRSDRSQTDVAKCSSGNGRNGRNRRAADEAYNARRREARRTPQVTPTVTPTPPEVTPERTPTTPADIDIESNRIESISNDSSKRIDSIRFEAAAPENAEAAPQEASTPRPVMTEEPLPADVMQLMMRLCRGKLTQHRAKELFDHYRMQRSLDICESLPHWKPDNPVKLMESAFKHGPERYPVHPAVIAEREAAARGPAQQSMPLVSLDSTSPEEREIPEIPGTGEDVRETRQYRFWTELPIARQAEIDAEIRRSMPDIHRSRWREGHPPPLAIAAQVELLRAERIDRLMNEAASSAERNAVEIPALGSSVERSSSDASARPTPERRSA